jgi:quercetin dioxygenase-like cupin family protein
VNVLDARAAARAAVTAHVSRPATAIVHDAEGARLVVFRLAPGQSVPVHVSRSTVQIVVLQGSGTLEGQRDEALVETHCAAGDVAVFAPNEPHGMRADVEELLLLATITPRPGSH